MRATGIILTLLSTLTFFSTIRIAAGQDQPTGWRGPNRDGHYPDKNLLETWPAGGPPLVWRFDGLGPGYASPAVTSNRVYTIGTLDSTSFVFCHDHQGTLLWKSQLGPEWVKNFPGSRSTPTLYQGMGYYTNGHGTVYAFRTSDGEICWKRDLMKECSGTNRNWGFVDNLIVDGNRVYCTPSGENKNVVALDRLSGKTLWESAANGENSGYCTPLLVENNNRKFLINQPGLACFALDTETGKMIWKYEKKEIHPSCHRTPIYRGGRLLFLDDETTGSVMLEITPDGMGSKVVWRNPDLYSVQGEAVVVGDRIYSPGCRNKLVCADWQTGKTLYSLPFGSGIFVLISAEGLIYSYDMKGKVTLLKPLADRIETVGSFQIPGGSDEHFSHPVISGSRLYIRHENSLFVYDISKKS